MNVTVDEIEKHPGKYLHRVLEGETVTVFRDDRPVAEIRPLSETETLRPIGLAAGEFDDIKSGDIAVITHRHALTLAWLSTTIER